jgi:ketosteroid isomerase-like protein
MDNNATKDIVQKYIATWNETDATRRRKAIDAIYTEDCRYIDPNADLSGREQVDHFIGAVQKQFPGAEFVLAGSLDAHHEQVRFTWHAKAPGGSEPVAIGFDVAVFENGRIKQVLGFLDKAPA